MPPGVFHHNTPHGLHVPDEVWSTIMTRKWLFEDQTYFRRLLLPHERADDDDLSVPRYCTQEYLAEREEYCFSFHDMLALAAVNRKLRKLALECHEFWRSELLSLHRPSPTVYGTAGMLLQSLLTTKTIPEAPLRRPELLFCNLVAQSFTALADAQRHWIITNKPLSAAYDKPNKGRSLGIVEGPVYVWRKDYALHAAKVLNAWFQSNFYKAQHPYPSLPEGQTVGFVIASCAQVFHGESLWHDLLTFCGRASIGYDEYATSYNSTLSHITNQLFLRVSEEAELTDKLILAQPNHPTLKTLQRPLGNWALDCIKYGSTHAALAEQWKNGRIPKSHIPEFNTCDNLVCTQQVPKVRGLRVCVLANIADESENFCSYWCLAHSALFSKAQVKCAGCTSNLRLADCFGLTPTSRQLAMDNTNFLISGIITRTHQGIRLMTILHGHVSRLRKLKMNLENGDIVDETPRLPTTAPSNVQFTMEEWEARREEYSYSSLTTLTGLGYGQAPLTDMRPQISAVPCELAVQAEEGYLGKVYCSHACRNGFVPNRCANYQCSKVLCPEFAAASLECAEVLFCRANGSRRHRAYVCDRVCGKKYLLQLAEATRVSRTRTRKKRELPAGSNSSPAKRARTSLPSETSETPCSNSAPLTIDPPIPDAKK